jgi:hypothetical protein
MTVAEVGGPVGLGELVTGTRVAVAPPAVGAATVAAPAVAAPAVAEPAVAAPAGVATITVADDAAAGSPLEAVAHALTMQVAAAVAIMARSRARKVGVTFL